MVRTLGVAALATMLAISVMLPTASAEESAAKKAYDEAINKCERMDKTDQREQCMDDARKEYEAAIAKEQPQKMQKKSKE